MEKQDGLWQPAMPRAAHNKSYGVAGAGLGVGVGAGAGCAGGVAAGGMEPPPRWAK